MDYRYGFDSILQGFLKKRFHLDHQFEFFLFCFQFFWIFSFALNIFQAFFKFSNNGVKYLLLDAFLMGFSVKFPQNYSLDQLESHKIDLLHQKSTCDNAVFSPFLSDLLYFILSHFFYIMAFIKKVKQQN